MGERTTTKKHSTWADIPLDEVKKMVQLQDAWTNILQTSFVVMVSIVTIEYQKLQKMRKEANYGNENATSCREEVGANVFSNCHLPMNNSALVNF